MDVSVIIPIYNGESDVPDLLTSLRHQTYDRPGVEYLVVDNRSTDRTPALLAAALDQAHQDHWPLRVLQETEIQSSYAARNQGIRQAQGDVLVFTDADCRPDPHWLDELLRPFEDPLIELVVGEIQGLPSRNWLERYADAAQTLSQRYTLEHTFCPYGQTANLALRRSVFKRIGLFRPYLTTGGDADFCWRALQTKDTPYQFADKAIVFHRHRSTLSELAQQWQRYGRSNRYLHDLHGCELMQPPRRHQQARRMIRWLLKELPRDMVHNLTHPDQPRILYESPLTLYCQHHRFLGQQNAQMPPQAHLSPPWDDTP